MEKKFILNNNNLIIMKKNYLKPKTINVELISEPLMNAVSGEQTGAGTGSGSAGAEDPEVAAPSRGEWGNLWE